MKKFKHKQTGEIATYNDGVLKSSGFCVEIGIEPSDKYWEEIKEEVQKEYEILKIKIKPCGTIITYCTEGKAIHRTDGYSIKFTFVLNEALKTKNTEIYSVKRLSDGEVFTIGDKLDGKSFTDSARHTLSEIDIWDNIITKIAIVKNTSNEVAGYGYTNMDGQLMFSASNKYKNLNVSLKDAIKAKQALFTTEDGVDIYEYQEYWFITNLDWKVKNHTMGISDRNYPPLGNKQFSTKDKAEEYIVMNKPCISINDVNNAYPSSKGSPLHNVLMNKLKQLVKSKI